MLIGVAAFATIGESSEDSGKSANPAPNAGATTGDVAEESSDAASSSSEPIPVGTATRVAKGWDVTVNSANLNADAILAADNQFSTPEAGSHFVLVNVTVANNSDEPAMAMTNVSLSMLPASGVAIDSTFSCVASVPDALDISASMQPGAVATGNVCFEVKEAEIATSLLLGAPTFTLDEAEDQRFFAIQ